MLDHKAPDLDDAWGERLDRAAYHEDFRRRRWAAEGRDSWKLERQQHFREPGNESWQAFARGDWNEALRIFEAQRPALDRAARDAEQHRAPFYRVRVVEEPLTPYLQWELHGLRVRDEVLGGIRVLQAGHVSALEEWALLPELVVLGGHTLYRVVYAEDGTADGAVRFLDGGLAAEWAEFIGRLHGQAEELSTYFARSVAPLPPPRPE